MGRRKKTVVEYETEAQFNKSGCLISRQKDVARKVYQLRHNIVLPSEIFVCHTCDTRRCILDAHHFPGTALDNSRDAVTKGRLRSNGFRANATAVKRGTAWWLTYEKQQSRHRELLRRLAEKKRRNRRLSNQLV